jgi:hypothetical protein
MATRAQLDATFNRLVACAVAGERCPQDLNMDPAGLRSEWVVELAHLGRIRILIYALNWRVVQIMEGPHAGKRTAPRPGSSQPPWKVINHNGTHMSGRRVPVVPALKDRPQPSKPRLLIPYAGKEVSR